MAGQVVIADNVARSEQTFAEGKFRRTTAQMGVDEFAREVANFYRPPQHFFPVPSGVRFWLFEGDNAILVIELEPRVRIFRWIKDAEDPGLEYQERNLALPYVILVLPFYNRTLQNGQCQVFFRTSPLQTWDDQLFMTNLLNAANGHGFTNWLCMNAYLQDPGLAWRDAVERAIRYFLWSAFNRNAEVHERNSHFQAIQALHIDMRLSSAEAWERASRGGPKFMCQIPWPKSPHTVVSAMKAAFEKLPQAKLNLDSIIQKNNGRGIWSPSSS